MKITNRKEELKEEIRVAQRALKENLTSPEVLSYIGSLLPGNNSSAPTLPSKSVLGSQSHADVQKEMRHYLQLLLD